MIGTLLTLSLLIVVAYWVQLGPNKVTLIRFGLNALLCWLLYRGVSWARVVMGLLAGISAVLSFLLGGVEIARAGALGALVTLGPALVYGICAWYLLFAKDLRAFAEYQRDLRA